LIKKHIKDMQAANKQKTENKQSLQGPWEKTQREKTGGLPIIPAERNEGLTGVGRENGK